MFKHLSKTHSSTVRSSSKQSGPDHCEVHADLVTLLLKQVLLNTTGLRVEDWDGQKADLEIMVKKSLPLPGMEPQVSCL